MRFTTRRLPCAALLAACVLAAGCSSDEKKPAKPHHKDKVSHPDPSYDPAHEPNPVISHDRASRDTTYDRPADRPTDSRGFQEVPTTAVAVDRTGAGGLEYESTRDGVMYVYDQDDDRVIFVGRMRDQERFRLDPEGGRALINSKTVYRGNLNPRHRYRLYFDRAN